MDVYFVRHGQTDGNVARRHQHPDTPLNEEGREQADRRAHDLRRVQATHLITSTQKRALETARVIGRVSDLIPETYPDFEEWKRPDFLLGERLLSLVTLQFAVRWFFGIDEASMHDGESYRDVLMRIVRARQQLEKLPRSAKVIVVSHSVFMNLFIAHACKSTRLGLFSAVIIYARMFMTKNTAVVHLRFTKSAAKHGCGWKVVDRW
jgi:broad specificity phosphatase PhoE